MAYAAWSVVAGEQPTAAKWNILGTNDASFNDGTGIGTGAISSAALAAGAVITSKVTLDGCAVRRSTSQVIATSTITVVLWDVEDYDTNAYHSTVSNTGRMTVATAGKYLIVANITFATSTVGARFLWFQKNGVTGRTGINGGNTPTGNDNGLTSAVVLNLAANDYIECIGYQSSGGNLNLQGEDGQIGYSAYSITRLGS